jgi:fumarate reductase iron-sulfur subunit
MDEKTQAISTLTRREIEAGIAGPLIRAFALEIGDEKAREVAGKVISELARKSGEAVAQFVGGRGLEEFAKGLELWSRDGALEFEILEQGPKKFSMNVTRCRYAEMYQRIGMPELGLLLSCHRDYAMIEGFNPKIRFSRTQTLMEGAKQCDFRYELSED